jgi:hypothetical protein
MICFVLCIGHGEIHIGKVAGGVVGVPHSRWAWGLMFPCDAFGIVSRGLQELHQSPARYSLGGQQAVCWEASPQQVRLGDALFYVVLLAW